jgi:hypothetical protein
MSVETSISFDPGSRLSIGFEKLPTTGASQRQALPALRCAARLQPWRRNVTT